MSTNIFSILNTAKVGLLAQQLAIEVTGQNIANVQTEGYSRQEVRFEPNTPRSIGVGQLGTGVRIESIKRSHNEFIFRQILGEGDRTGNFQVRKEVFDKLEILFNESTGRSLNATFSQFYSSLQDLATNPSGLAERSNLLAQGEALVSEFNNIGEQLFQMQRDIDLVLADEITEINTLVTQIQKLNDAIHANEPGKSTANDLRDSRDRLVKQLSEKLDITVVNQSDTQITITLQNGTPLLLGSTVFELSTGINGDNNSFLDIFINDGSGARINITSSIQNGKVRGNLDMRDTEIDQLKDKMNLLAAGFVTEFNRIHHQGFGLDGSTGVNFFAELTPTVLTNTQNTGGAIVTAANGDPTRISTDKYEIKITGTNTFTLNNLTRGASSGTFTFTSGSAFNLANGFAVTITGSPAVGDKFEISVSENAATTMALASEVVADSRKIAAGQTIDGDGNNALALADLQNDLLFDSISTSVASGTFTFDEFYNAIVSTVGIQSFAAQATVAQQEGVMLQLDNRRESESGVSIDEELINMIKFQQAFNAAARLVTVVDEMLDVLNRQL